MTYESDLSALLRALSIERLSLAGQWEREPLLTQFVRGLGARKAIIA
jgi:hypothetical protein